MIDATARQAEHSDNSNEMPVAARPTTRSFVIYIAAFFVVWSLRATVFIRIDEGIGSDRPVRSSQF